MCKNSSFVPSEIHDIAWQVQYYSCQPADSDISQITVAAAVTFCLFYILFAYSELPLPGY